MPLQHKEQTLLDQVTATTTSAPMNVEGYRHIGLQFVRANHSAGSTAFTVEGTIDGTNWVALNVLLKNIVADAGAGTAGEDIGNTRVASVTLSANGSEIVWIEPIFALKAIRAIATETTDGTHSVYAIASE